MSGRRIDMLHRAAARFIKTQVPDQSQLALVTFSTVPKMLADLTLVTPETRQLLADRVPYTDDGGNTAIGQGLQLAMKVLSDKDATDGGIIILISDGEENVLPNVADIIPEILRSRVRINTIAFGNQASQHLEKLVRLTGGHGYFFSDDDISGNKVGTLQAAFFAAVSTQSDVELQPVELNNNIFDIPPGSEQRGKIVVDQAIGKNTQFIFTAEKPSGLEIALKTPSKKIHNNRTKSFIPDKNSGAASFVIPMAEVGKWEYRIKNNFYLNQVVGVSVISEPKDIRKQPIRIKAWISDVQFDYQQNANEAKIFAEVKKKYTPILGATVVALVERPNGDDVEVELHDLGAGADIKKNDGIYSAYFTQFKGSGRYSVSARVVNDGNARVRVKKIGKPKQGALTIKKFDPEDFADPPNTKFNSETMQYESDETKDDFVEDFVDDFQRSLLAGAFLLNGWIERDILPPNRVIDLQVETMSEQCVNLTWTAAGDDMDTGTANWTEIRYHTEAIAVYKNFDSGFLVTEKDVQNGTLVPEYGGKQHWVVICISFRKENTNTVYFALRNRDKSQNVGGVSNIAEAHFPKEHQFPVSQLTLFVVCAVVGAFILSVLGLVLLRSFRKHQLREKEFI